MKLVLKHRSLQKMSFIFKTGYIFSVQFVFKETVLCFAGSREMQPLAGSKSDLHLFIPMEVALSCFSYAEKLGPKMF